MTMKSKTDLKDVFSGLSSILMKNGESADFTTFVPDYDMPVTVDSLSMTQEAPTLNHNKVHGLQSDWAVTATAGNFTFSATVPSVSTDVVGFFMGTTTPVATAAINSVNYTGVAASLTANKIVVSIALISEDKSHCVAINRMALYATPLFENASTTPFGFKLTGSIELTDTSENSVWFLKKAV